MTPAPDDLAGEPRSVVLLILRDGRWLIDSIREAVGAAPLHYGRLKELGWMVGDWASEAHRPFAVSVHSTCDWTANGSYLIRNFTIRRKDSVAGGTEVIGWDPRAHRIRSWIFESDGGFGESEWTRSATGRKKGTGPICRNGPEGVSHKLDLSPFPRITQVYLELPLCH